ncbi:MAG TPA: hypothetical protein VHD15_10550, partial [Hyphomicrobiales bacterium]|nr:hypothetical protein [Hyphomicrobiales bacterium]
AGPAKAVPMGPPAAPPGPPRATEPPATPPAAAAIAKAEPPGAPPLSSLGQPRPEPAFGAPELRRSRWPAIAAGVVVLLVAAIGSGAYLARDQLADMLTATPAPAKGTASVSAAPPKIVERVGTDSTASANAPAATTNAPAATGAPATAPSAPATAPNTTVARLDKPPTQPSGAATEATPAASQRAILYEETPDRQSGSAFVGTATWSIDAGIEEAGHPRQTALIADVVIPERKLRLKMTIKRNTDQTLPASHTIDLQFTLPSDFANGGIANVPGILFKPTEEAGGQALAALSVRVMDNFFLIGLSNNPAEQAKNLAAIRDNGWIDLPVLYDNGRRAVLTFGKGAAGTKAFEQALAAWQQEAATAANTPPPTAGAPSGAAPAGQSPSH